MTARKGFYAGTIPVGARHMQIFVEVRQNGVGRVLATLRDPFSKKRYGRAKTVPPSTMNPRRWDE